MVAHPLRATERRVLSENPPGAARYRVGSLLGQGDSGAVYRAIDTLTGETVALKRLAPKMRADAEIASRFAALTAAAARIDSRHVVHVRGIEREQDGAPLLVLELVEGTDLARLIQTSAPLPATRVIHFATQILEALRAAHAAGILHCRLRPSDCLVTEEGSDPDVIKLINFGGGQVSSELDAVTDSPAVQLALAYVAPEQIKNPRAATPQSDLYSLGAILYEMLTRRRPFEADERNALILKICTEPPTPLHDLRPDLSAELCAAIEHALVKSPTGRARTAIELSDALLAVPEARSSAVSIATRAEHGVDPMAATIMREAFFPVAAPAAPFAPRNAAFIPPNAPSSEPRHHLVPHPDPWATVVSVAVLLFVAWAIYATLHPSHEPTPLPTTAMTFDEPITPPRPLAEPKPVATPVETAPIPTHVAPKPIVVPKILTPAPVKVKQKPKIGGAQKP